MIRSESTDDPETSRTPRVVELEGVCVQYGAFTALSDLTLELSTGATGLVGRNGAGKSTLLRLLLGLIRPTKGTGRVLGVPLRSAGPQLRRAVGYMPENDAFLPGMRAIEQVTLAGELCSLSHREAIRRSHEVLTYTGLGEARYRNVEGFSTGMKQRLKLAIALVHDPELLLLDEPTVGLDPPGRERMLDLIADLVRHHSKSLIISTHLFADIQHTCSQVVMVEKGRVLSSGRLEDVAGRDRERWLVRWEGAVDPFVDRIRSAGGVVEVKNRTVLPKRIGRESEALLRIPADWTSTQIFEAARDSGVRLRMVDREYEELSDRYHRLLDQGAANGA